MSTSRKFKQFIKFSVALDMLGMKRYCCRRMLISHVDLIEKLLLYNSNKYRVFNNLVYENANTGMSG